MLRKRYFQIQVFGNKTPYWINSYNNQEFLTILFSTKGYFMKKRYGTWILVLLCTVGLPATQPAAQPPVSTQRDNLIQIALLLDVSNSMDGLINQAKSQLWSVVNDLARSKKHGKTPQLEVALYEYGKSSLAASQGYIRCVVPLTIDLDKISQELFDLTTKGGNEYCGMVIERAARELQWTKDNTALKIVFIAGNEPFTQGSVDYKESCKAAIEKGIIVNTIFCGDQQEGIDTKWKDGADRADGSYMTIDQNQTLATVTAPQDTQIIRLSKELNSTYISYGTRGWQFKARQAEQDNKALSLAPEAMITRSVTKSSKLYNNQSWDLVDAKKQNNDILDEIKDEELPQEMRTMNSAQREAYIDSMAQKRYTIQQRINSLNKQRDAYIKKEQKKMVQENTLGNAMITIIRKQAAQKQFLFE